MTDERSRMFSGFSSLLHCNRIHNAYFPDSSTHQGYRKEAERYVSPVILLWFHGGVRITSLQLAIHKNNSDLTFTSDEAFWIHWKSIKQTHPICLLCTIYNMKTIPETGLTSFLLLSSLPAASIVICCTIAIFGENSTKQNINKRKIHHYFKRAVTMIFPKLSLRLLTDSSPFNNSASRCSAQLLQYSSLSSEVT